MTERLNIATATNADLFALALGDGLLTEDKAAAMVATLQKPAFIASALRAVLRDVLVKGVLTGRFDLRYSPLPEDDSCVDCGMRHDPGTCVRQAPRPLVDVGGV